MIGAIGASVVVAVAAITYFTLSRKGLHCTYCALKKNLFFLVNWVILVYCIVRVNELGSFV